MTDRLGEALASVRLCPDLQSPELSVPCPTLPQQPTQGGALAYTGELLSLLIGIAIGLVVAGAVFYFYYWRSRHADDE